MLTPEGLWVAYRLQLKRTRNPSCFRSTRYFGLEAGQHAAISTGDVAWCNVPTLGIRRLPVPQRC